MARCKNSHIRASARMYHIVYKTTCLVSGRYYIGMHSTDDLDDGYLGSGVRLVRSVKKHGRDQHIREVLCSCTSRQEASNKEKELITEEVRSDPMSMNCAAGGMGATDRPATKEETREKLSVASKQAVRTEEWCSKISNSLKGKTHTTQSKDKMSKARKGKKLAEDHKSAISSGLVGHEVTIETRQKIGDAHRGKPKPSLQGRVLSDETKEKLRQAQCGRKYSDESRALMSLKARTRAERNRQQKQDGQDSKNL